MENYELISLILFAIIIVASIIFCLIIYFKDKYFKSEKVDNITLSNPIYVELTDTLYASIDGSSLDSAYCIKTMMNGTSLFYNEDDILFGVEIYGFREQYGEEFPININLQKNYNLNLKIESVVIN